MIEGVGDLPEVVPCVGGCCEPLFPFLVSLISQLLNPLITLLALLGVAVHKLPNAVFVLVTFGVRMVPFLLADLLNPIVQVRNLLILEVNGRLLAVNQLLQVPNEHATDTQLDQDLDQLHRHI